MKDPYNGVSILWSPNKVVVVSYPKETNQGEMIIA